MNKIKALLQLDIHTKCLWAEAFLYLGWARLLKSMPFERISKTLGQHMQETSFGNNPAFTKTLIRISSAIHIMSRYTCWESHCLVKAIAAMKMLERRHIESTLYLGTAKDEAGKLVAHAWLRSGSFYLSGSEIMDNFTVVSHFAQNCGKRLKEI